MCRCVTIIVNTTSTYNIVSQVCTLPSIASSFSYFFLFLFSSSKVNFQKNPLCIFWRIFVVSINIRLLLIDLLFSPLSVQCELFYLSFASFCLFPDSFGYFRVTQSLKWKAKAVSCFSFFLFFNFRSSFFSQQPGLTPLTPGRGFCCYLSHLTTTVAIGAADSFFFLLLLQSMMLVVCYFLTSPPSPSLHSWPSIFFLLDLFSPIRTSITDHHSPQSSSNPSDYSPKSFGMSLPFVVAVR